MKTQKNILIAFFLNVGFSIFEFIGGIITGSVAIISDAVHDTGDAVSIGLSYFLEKKSKKQPDKVYTYGYSRFSVLAGLISTIVLLFGSLVVIYSAIERLVNPVQINYSGMVIIAVFGVVINLIATLVTRKGDSLNQKSVNLHMLEDVLGWVIVLIGSVVMLFTDISILDPIMSIIVSLIILFCAIKNLKNIFSIFLGKLPKDIDIEEIKKCLKGIQGIQDVHHIHIWSLDGENNYATMHIVVFTTEVAKIKQLAKNELKNHNICHSTIEIDSVDEHCEEGDCVVKESTGSHHH